MTNEDMLHVLRRERECVLLYAGKYREHPENADETPTRCTHDCEGCDLPLDDSLVLETYDRLIAMLEGEEKARTLTLEEIQASARLSQLLPYLDVLVDGPFILEQRDTDLLFRGSPNQRIIYLHGEPPSDDIPGTVALEPLR